jgi:hypothetical protein
MVMTLCRHCRSAEMNRHVRHGLETAKIESVALKAGCALKGTLYLGVHCSSFMCVAQKRETWIACPFGIGTGLVPQTSGATQREERVLLPPSPPYAPIWQTKHVPGPSHWQVSVPPNGLYHRPARNAAPTAEPRVCVPILLFQTKQTI